VLESSLTKKLRSMIVLISAASLSITVMTGP
jgi:hypothetical protein